MKSNFLAIFDLDGVLIESRDVHFDSLNIALSRVDSKYVITRDEHLSKYDGLGTTTKLKMLTNEKGLPESTHQRIWEDKQQATLKILSQFPKNYVAIDIMQTLKERGWKIAVASNAIRETVITALDAIGVLKYVSYIMSNEDVKHHKPHPEMYWQCIVSLDSTPANTIIIEDSHIGREGALSSGANLHAIKNANDLNKERLMRFVDEIETRGRRPVAWRNEKMNVLIPMAGAGSRFAQAGYTFPKPLIEVNGKPMIQVVV